MRVSAGLCFQGEKIWIFKRGPGRKNAHLWEFPGGKEESGETPADCLVRELREELSLEVSPPQIVREADCEGIHFTFLRCEALNAPRCTEHEDCTLAGAAAICLLPGGHARGSGAGAECTRADGVLLGL